MTNGSRPHLQLKVAEAPRVDVGLGRARVDTKTRLALGVEAGDVVEVVGKRNTVAKLFRGTDKEEGKALVRVDGLVRRNLGVSNPSWTTTRLSSRSCRALKVRELENSPRRFANSCSKRGAGASPRPHSGEI